MEYNSNSPAGKKVKGDQGKAIAHIFFFVGHTLSLYALDIVNLYRFRIMAIELWMGLPFVNYISVFKKVFPKLN